MGDMDAALDCHIEAFGWADTHTHTHTHMNAHECTFRNVYPPDCHGGPRELPAHGGDGALGLGVAEGLGNIYIYIYIYRERERDIDMCIYIHTY